jgi:Domain of unknown function (DUF4388)
MALTGHLSDLSLSELIEFFCNQRKTGYLKVLYPRGPGYFYLQTGSVVDAKIGVLRGIDAVYYALTLPNAAFEFKGGAEMTERTINQPWTQVVLEGLRRLDEGITPADAFPESLTEEAVNHSPERDHVEVSDPHHVGSRVPAFLSMMHANSMGNRRTLVAGAIATAVLASVAAIGFPAGWYGKHKPPASPNQPTNPAASESPVKEVASQPQPSPPTDTRASAAADLATKRQREKERARAREERANAAAGSDSGRPPSVASGPTAPVGGAAKSAPKKVTVQVTFDESGRVVQAAGADATALRIARQKRFPPGKAGTATITIPMN